MTATAVMSQSDFQGATHEFPFNEAPINYDAGRSRGPIAKLRKQIAAGKTQLEWDTARGYLPALLKHLGISPDSQMLVFSKTSLQRDHISRTTPRALYFNDQSYIGWMPGAPLIEISEVDPEQGAVFYELAQNQLKRPEIKPSSRCLTCHASSRTLGVPGHVVRSIQTHPDGEPDFNRTLGEVNHRTPVGDRWAGWYVTGSGELAHRGNGVGFNGEPQPRSAKKVIQLADPERYLRSTSDAVALLIHDHQTHGHNLITRVSFETRSMLYRYGHLNYLKQQTEALLRYLLFVEETPLGRLDATSAFAKSFEKAGPFDSQGRSLRKLRLHGRLFEYPCSFLIYSDAFDAIPKEMKARLYQRLHEILTGEDRSETYQNISSRNKQAICGILKETKKDLPEYWNKNFRTQETVSK